MPDHIQQVALRIAKLIQKIAHSETQVQVDKHGDTRKVFWHAQLEVPEYLQKFLRFQYDHSLQLVLDGPEDSRVLEQLFNTFIELFVKRPHNLEHVFGSYGHLAIEIVYQGYAGGKGGRIYFRQLRKKQFLQPRLIAAYLEYLSDAPVQAPPTDDEEDPRLSHRRRVMNQLQKRRESVGAGDKKSSRSIAA
jgi:hypothetical protein